MLLALFQQISLVSPIANTFAIPLVSLVVVPLTLLGAVLPLDAPLWLAHWLMNWSMVCLTWLSALPQAVWTQHEPPAWSIVAGMLGVIWILLPHGFPARWLGLLFMLPMFFNVPPLPAQNTLRLIVFDVGQGLAVAAQTRHHALLYDTGPDFSNENDSGNRILIPALRAMGIAKLDGLILTHGDSDHTGGAASVMQAMPINWLLSSLPDEHALLQQATQPIKCADGQRWNWDGVSFEILHPDISSYQDEKIRDNDRGCVMRISIGEQRILLTADIEKKSEARLINKHADKLYTTLLVAPHHGSKTSSTLEFIAATLPDYAVFTAGYRNRFGHPRQEVVQRYTDSGAVVMRSDQDGAILVDMDAQSLHIERYRETHRRYWTHVM
jgi:competence protein ComEC